MADLILIRACRYERVCHSDQSEWHTLIIEQFVVFQSPPFAPDTWDPWPYLPLNISAFKVYKALVWYSCHYLCSIYIYQHKYKSNHPNMMNWWFYNELIGAVYFNPLNKWFHQARFCANIFLLTETFTWFFNFCDDFCWTNIIWLYQSVIYHFHIRPTKRIVLKCEEK